VAGREVEIEQRCREGRERKRKCVEQDPANECGGEGVVAGHDGSGYDERKLGDDPDENPEPEQMTVDASR